MLARFFGKKCDHPMADIKAVQALLADLPKHDPLKSVIELTELIESATNPEDFKLADQIAALSLLDEATQPYARKLAGEYFTLPEMITFQGNRLCQVLGNLSRQTATAYFTLFSRCRDDDKAAGALKELLPLLMACAVGAMREQLKYAAVHYVPHDDTVWRQLAQLYRHAEQQNYLDTSLNIYSALAEPTSIRRELAQLLAWYACGKNSLTPRSMHLTERIIAQYGSAIEITPNLGKNALFSFDLAYPLDPVRVNLDATAHPLMRYISLAGMQSSLERLIKSLEKNSVPQELNPGGHFSAEWLLEAARHIASYLAAPPARLSKRRELAASLNVVAGYENVFWRCEYLGQESCEYPPMQWTLENASTGGICAVMAGQGADGVRIGALLGVQTAGVPRLAVATVRHLLRDADGHLHIGAEMLANQVFAVTLRQSVTGGMEEGQTALWLHAKADVENGMVRLLMQAATFSMHRSLKTCLEGRNYLLIPGELLENGLDYDLVRCRVVQQEESFES